MDLSELEKDELNALEKLASEELDEDWNLQFHQLIGRVRGRSEGMKERQRLADVATISESSWPPFVSSLDPISKMTRPYALAELEARRVMLGKRIAAGEIVLPAPPADVCSPTPPKRRAKRRLKK